MKHEIRFDELDVKCFEDIPFLVDVLTGTVNRIADSLLPYFHDLEPIISDTIRPKRGWRITETQEKVFYPLSDEESRKKIRRLQNYLYIRNFFLIEQIIAEKQKNLAVVELGYYFDAATAEPEHCIYFGCYRGEWEVKQYGPLQDAGFYDRLACDLEHTELRTEHPDREDNEEFAELRVNRLDGDLIGKAYGHFREKILNTYLKALPG